MNKQEGKSEEMISKFRSVANDFEKEVTMMKFRWVGNTIIYLILISAIIFAYSTKNDNVLIIDSRSGNVFNTSSGKRNDWQVLAIEADAHARRFYGTFWSFDHNNLDKQMQAASYLGGKVLGDIYKRLKGDNYYNNIKSNGYYSVSEIDSLEQGTFRMENGRVYMKVFGHQKLTNNVFVEMRRLDMEILMVPVDRIMVHNPNGFSIEAINIISNQTISKEHQ